MKVVIACAGTGGHINPGIAIANKIKKEDKMAKIIFIGTNRGLENDLVPRAGYELKTVEAYGLSKKINLTTIINNIKTLRSIKSAKEIMKQFKPDIVIGTGGYICGPVILAASKLKIPTLLHESNAFPGKAVKMLAKRVDTILVSFNEAKPRIKNAKKIVLTGTPTKIKKMEMTREHKEKIISEVGLNKDKPIVLIFGGSQGAKAINDTIVKLINSKLNRKYQIIWAPGQKQYEYVKENIKVKLEGVKIVPYIYNMEQVLNICDLVISRSGAMTITEISKVGKPAIFVPLPNVSNNHQEYNAKVLENVEAAFIIKNDELNENNLNRKIEQIITSKETIEKMSNNAQKIDIDNVEDKIYEEIRKLTER